MKDLHASLEGQMMMSFVEPCPECACGKCGNCDGRTLDHARDEIVPCPCRAAGHTNGATA